MPVNTSFSGTLYFEDGSDDRIAVNRLIIREREIAFHFVATWNGTTTKIEVDGIANQDGSRYVSEGLNPKPINSGFLPVTIEFRLLEPVDGGGLYVKGRWGIKTTELDFAGDLESTTRC